MPMPLRASSKDSQPGDKCNDGDDNVNDDDGDVDVIDDEKKDLPWNYYWLHLQLMVSFQREMEGTTESLGETHL